MGHPRLQGNWSPAVCSPDLACPHAPVASLRRPLPALSVGSIVIGPRNLESAPLGTTLQWARLTASVDAPLRRGAWYQVASVTRLEAVVTVEGRPVNVPLPFVEIRNTPPRAWTVLRTPRAGPGTPEVFRRGFLIGPPCRNRLPLPATEVAWQL